MSIPNQRIDVSVTPEEAGQSEDLLTQLEASLPFLISLTRDERRRLFWLGGKSALFVEKAHELARENIEVLPRGLDVDELDRDAALRATLLPLKQRLTVLLTKIDDTYALAGNDLMRGAMVVYRSLRAHGDSAGLREATRDLGTRFQKRRRKAPAQTSWFGRSVW